eukprot:m.369315 g.369315  ORF g.369315 m.369315 type:complete len:567 (-) comp28120_c0_seq2:7048-8748(-)
MAASAPPRSDVRGVDVAPLEGPLAETAPLLLDHSLLWTLSAVEMVRHLRAHRITPTDAVKAAIARIRETSGINAVVTVCESRALEAAAHISPDSLLAGLPFVVKDLTAVAGVRLTKGSRLLEDNVAGSTDHLVSALERAGGIVVGITNTPEFGAGANTFNDVFGPTLNPFDTRRSAGGSSGGSAAALAAGQAWLAVGNDLGGSLRIPAAFCGVVGFRPSPGLLVQGPDSAVGHLHVITGPMARNIPDLSLMLDAMDATAPPVGTGDGSSWVAFAEAAARQTDPLELRVLWSADLGGTCPCELSTTAVCRNTAAVLRDAGAVVTMAEESPAAETSLRELFGPSDRIFRALRGQLYKTNETFPVGPDPDVDDLIGWLERDEVSREWATVVKPEIRWNVAAGVQQVDGAYDVACDEHRQLLDRVDALFKDHDLLICPCVMVPPFDVRIRYIQSFGEGELSSYVEWLRTTYAITLTNCPAISFPVGFTASGHLPIGLQIIGPPDSDHVVIAAAARLEVALKGAGFSQGVPRLPSTWDSPLDHAGDAPVSGPTTAAEARSLHVSELLLASV